VGFQSVQELTGDLAGSHWCHGLRGCHGFVLSSKISTSNFDQGRLEVEIFALGFSGTVAISQDGRQRLTLATVLRGWRLARCAGGGVLHESLDCFAFQFGWWARSAFSVVVVGQQFFGLLDGLLKFHGSSFLRAR
jgi:hypothetical protein